MGARPIALLAALSAPSDTPVELLAAISRGLRERAAREGASLVGGDLGGADMLTLTITALGVLEAGREPVRRSGARPGDVLVVGSDQLGRSAAGLALVLSGRCSVTADGRETAVCWDGAPLTADGAVLGAGLDAPAAAVLRWHQAPDPDLGLGPRHGARLHALLDVSDGLGRDAERIAAASGVHVDIDPSALEKDVRMLAPLAAALGEDARDWVYAGGEEHCLLGTCAADDVPEGFRVIGRIADGAGVTIGGAVPAARGWDHFG